MLEGSRYGIEHVNSGHFAISFPDGNRHKKLQEHLIKLQKFALSKYPEWYVENKSRNYK